MCELNFRTTGGLVPSVVVEVSNTIMKGCTSVVSLIRRLRLWTMNKSTDDLCDYGRRTSQQMTCVRMLHSEVSP